MRGVAVITGASSGIGAATARRFAAEGFDVVVGARRVDRLQSVADEIGARAGLRAMRKVLRLELLGRPIRVTSVTPGWWRPTSASCGSTATRSRRPPSTPGSTR